jgi:hypothetical protein
LFLRNLSSSIWFWVIAGGKLKRYVLGCTETTEPHFFQRLKAWVDRNVTTGILPIGAVGMVIAAQ